MRDVINIIKETIQDPKILIPGLVVTFIAFIIKTIFKIPKWICNKLKNNSQNDDYKKLVKELNIESLMKNEFPEYNNNFLLVQYGSSVKYNTNPNDKDYIVLMLGYKKDARHLHNRGTNEYSSSHYAKDKIDIVYRDYFSFLFAACSGMPYENSIIQEGICLYGEKGYFNWLKNITRNELFDKEFILKRFEEKLRAERDEYKKSIEKHEEFEHDKYYIIRAGYYLSSSIFQYVCIKKMNNIITVKDIIPLSKVEMFYDIIEDLNIKNKYKRLVETLKRNNYSDNYNIDDIKEILQYAYSLINDVEDVIFNDKGQKRVFSPIHLKTSFYEELQKNEWAKINEEPANLVDNLI